MLRQQASAVQHGATRRLLPAPPSAAAQQPTPGLLGNEAPSSPSRHVSGAPHHALLQVEALLRDFQALQSRAPDAGGRDTRHGVAQGLRAKLEALAGAMEYEAKASVQPRSRARAWGLG